jgi:hypothetical protein
MDISRHPILAFTSVTLLRHRFRSPGTLLRVQLRLGGFELFWNLIGVRFIIGQVTPKVRYALDARRKSVIQLSSDWDSLVTGSLDISIKSVASSPSFVSADAGYEYSTIL